MRSNIEPSPCFTLCSSSVRRMLDRSTAPPGTSIDFKTLMNASLRRLTSSSFGCADDGVEARLSLREEIFGVLGSGHGWVPTVRVLFRWRERRGGSAVVGAGTEQW